MSGQDNTASEQEEESEVWDKEERAIQMAILAQMEKKIELMEKKIELRERM